MSTPTSTALPHKHTTFLNQALTSPLLKPIKSEIPSSPITESIESQSQSQLESQSHPSPSNTGVLRNEQEEQLEEAEQAQQIEQIEELEPHGKLPLSWTYKGKEYIFLLVLLPFENNPRERERDQC